MPAECVILPDGVYLLSMYANIITMTYTFYQRKIKLASSKSFFFWQFGCLDILLIHSHGVFPHLS